MGMMIIRHRVRDYGQWRPIFDAHAEMQKAAGLSLGRLVGDWGALYSAIPQAWLHPRFRREHKTHTQPPAGTWPMLH